MSIIKNTLSHASGTLSQLRRLRSGGFQRVLIYHDIAPKHENLFFQQIQFAQQHYQFIDIETFCENYQNKQLPKIGNILLTFDDGFKSNRIIAEKYLNPLGIKATFFIIPEFIDCQDDGNQQRKFISRNIYAGNLTEIQLAEHMRPMNWDDIHFLLQHGHTIACHSHSHQKLSYLSEQDELNYEINAAADKLEKQLGTAIKYFAYPFGDVESINAQSATLVKKRYQYMFSGVRGNNHPQVDRYAIRRDHVEPYFSLKMFQFIIEGGLWPFYHFKRKKLDSVVRL